MNRSRHRPIPYLFTQNTNHTMEEVCESLADGVSVSLVDPVLYDELSNEITNYVNNQSMNHDDPRFLILLNCQNEIRKYQENYLINAKSPRRIRKTVSAESYDKYKDMMNEVIYSKTIPLMSQQDKNGLIAFMQKEKRIRNKEEDFKEALKIQEGITMIQRNEQIEKLNQIQETEIDELMSKLKQAKNNLKDMKERWESLVERCEKHKENELSKLKSAQQEEYNKAAEKYANDPPPSFKKPSLYLQELNIRKKALVCLKKYEEVEQLKEEIKRRSENEKRENAEEWNKLGKSQLSILESKHRRDYNNHALALQRELDKLKLAMNEEIQSATNKVSYFKEQIDQRNVLQRSATMQTSPRKKQGTRSIKRKASTQNLSQSSSASLIRNRKKIAHVLYTVHPSRK